MPITVEIPGEDTEVDFPDDMPEGAMRHAIWSQFPSTRPADYESKVKESLGLSGKFYGQEDQPDSVLPPPSDEAVEKSSKPAFSMPDSAKSVIGKAATYAALGDFSFLVPDSIKQGIGDALGAFVEGATSPSGAAMLAGAVAQPQAILTDMLQGVRSGATKTLEAETAREATAGAIETAMSAVGVAGIMKAGAPQTAKATAKVVEPTVAEPPPLTSSMYRQLPAPRMRMPEFQEGTLEAVSPRLRTAIPAPGETGGTILLQESPIGPRTEGYRVKVEPFQERVNPETPQRLTPEEVDSMKGAIEISKQMEPTGAKPYKPPTVKTDLRQLEKILRKNTISTMETWADGVIKDKLGGSSANPFLDPEFMAAAVTKGAIIARRGVVNFAEWSKPMVAQFGRDIIPHLEQLHKDSIAMVGTRKESAAASDATSKVSGGTPPPPPSPPSLDDIYSRFVPDKPTRRNLGQVVSDSVEAVRTGFSSKFRPLDKLAEDVAKEYGTPEPKKTAHIMEALSGSSGKAEADVYRFDRAVSDTVKSNPQDFNAYMMLQRSLDRLRSDEIDIQRAQAGEDVKVLSRKQVADYTIPQLEEKLDMLREKVGPEKYAELVKAGEEYQVHMDNALRLQVESGRMSEEVYQDIKEGNQFYAPFKIQKYLDNALKPEGSGRTIDTTADYTKAITGIHDKNFKLGDIIAAGRQNIALSRVLAEKNKAMLRLAEVAKDDTEGLYIRKLEPMQKAAREKEEINVYENGKHERYEVNPDVAKAVSGMNQAATDIFTTALKIGAKPFKAGAIGLNMAFQPVNLLFADAPRSALASKYGVHNMADLVKFPMDFVEALYASMEPRVSKLVSGTPKTSKLYMDFLDSGVAGSTIQDFLDPAALRFRSGKSRFSPASLIENAEDFSRAIEEVNKIVGVKRAMREHGVGSGADLAKQYPDAVTEIRRFSGSPDFTRMGNWTESAKLNLLFMFFNARVQGPIADIGRLAGRDGAKMAASTNAKAIAAIGIPTTLLYIYNNLPQFKADYDQRPKNEKDNYWLIPKSTFIEDDYGNKVRDYWRIPKRELGKLYANTVERGLKFADENDPKAFWSIGTSLLENLAPINIEGRDSKERVESVVSSLNPMLKGPIEIGTGRNTYRHRDIIADERMKKATPELQYRDSTPKLFVKLAEAMPDMAPELLRSPLMLENIVQNYTAGLITQFLAPEKPVKGREGVESSRFLRRFQAVPYTENPESKEMIDTLNREAADAYLMRDRAARTALETNTLQNAMQIVGKTKDVALIKRTFELGLARDNGITPQEKPILNLPVVQRAEYIATQLKKLDADGKQKLLIDYVKKRIANEEVLIHVAELMKATNK